jgi:hypothetical protein
MIMTAFGGKAPGAARRRRGRLGRRWPHGRRRVLVLLQSLWFLGFMAVTAPHLVHHAFDPDGGADCAFLDMALHAPGASAAPVLVLQLLPASDCIAVPRTPIPPLVALASPPSRGPPAPTLAPA